MKMETHSKCAGLDISCHTHTLVVLADQSKKKLSEHGETICNQKF